MDLFVVVIAIAFLQVWGSDNPLHKDSWVDAWVSFVGDYFAKDNRWIFVFSVGIPLVALALLIWLISRTSYWPLLPIGVVILLYSFGRGEFSEILQNYINACREDDWEHSVERAAHLGVDVRDVEREDWSTLHQHVLDEAAYRGFERMFAVLFWFFIFGPVGAFAYRLIYLVNKRYPEVPSEGHKLLWLLEWPAVRVLGLSFALTGNFVGCISRWRDSVFCFQRATRDVAGQSVLGALSVDDTMQASCEVTQKELLLLNGLYQRTLWFWLAAAALFIILV